MEPELVDQTLSAPNAHARRASSAMAALSYATGDGHAVTPPEAAALLGELAEVLLRMSDSMRGIGNGLRQSLTTHDIVGADGKSPNAALVRAQALLQSAADVAAAAVDDVWGARDAVAPYGVAGTRAPRADDSVSF